MAEVRVTGRFVAGLSFIAAELAIIEVLVRTGWIRRALLPPPSDIARTLWEIVSSGEFLPPLASTLGLLAIGYTLSVMLGVALGLVMGVSRTCSDIFEPLLEAIRPIPKVALVPVLILFFGIDTTMKVASVVLASFFPVLLNTIQGVRGVEPTLIATGQTFGHRRLGIAIRVMLPASVPYILAGMKVSLGIGLLTTILAEMLSGTGGLGSLVLESQRSFKVRQMYSWLVILGGLGLLLNWAFAKAERRFVPWLDKYQKS